jgi:hypothetical protein
MMNAIESRGSSVQAGRVDAAGAWVKFIDEHGRPRTVQNNNLAACITSTWNNFLIDPEHVF